MTMGSIVHEQTATKVSVTWAGEGLAFVIASVQSPSDAVQEAWDSYTGSLKLYCCK